MSEEEILQEQELEKAAPIDSLDVEGLEQKLNSAKEEFEGPDLETRTKEIIRSNYCAFLDINPVRVARHCKDFLTTVSQSNHPYFQEMKAGIEGFSMDSMGSRMQLLAKVRNSLTEETMLPEAWIDLLHEYKDRLVAYQKYLNNAKHEINADLVRSFERINQDLEHPKPDEEIQKTLDSVELRICDPLTFSYRGLHSEHSRTICLKADGLFDTKEDGYSLSEAGLITLSHEELHLLSTGEVMRHELTTVEADGHESTLTAKTPQWSGLSAGGFNLSRFDWINEALTENLAAQWSDGKAGSYARERELLEMLLNRGKIKIDRRLLTNVYFEKKGRQAKKSGMEFWKRFQDELRASYDDPRFFVKLDILVQEQGIEKGLELLRNWDPENPQDIDMRETESMGSTQDVEELRRIRTELGLENTDA